jgi:hypothetical protein
MMLPLPLVGADETVLLATIMLLCAHSGETCVPALQSHMGCCQHSCSTCAKVLLLQYT